MNGLELTIRGAKPEDRSAILDLISQLGYDVEPNRYLTLMGVLMARDGHSMLVAELDSEVVGFANLHFRTFLRYGDLVATLDELCVDQTRRSQGIGSALVEGAIAVCLQRGAHHLELTTNNRRTDALRFYERLGFEVTSHKLVYQLAGHVQQPGGEKEPSYARR